MLHDVLFALSGYTSPLFDETDELPGLEASEKALLKSLGRLGAVHRALKSLLHRICSTHVSIVCRATATALRNSHLSKFQDAILDVERQILSNDSELVGAYKIVPLAIIVSKFGRWRRKLDWYWNLACFMFPVESASSVLNDSSMCNGAQLLDRLQQDSQTGYSDIEEVALDLLIVAQRSWMKHLSRWLLSYQPDAQQEVHNHDFFVQSNQSDQSCHIEWNLIPAFVTHDTAGSILFIGKTQTILNRSQSSNITMRGTQKQALGSSEMADVLDIQLLRQCDLLQNLSRLKYPLSSAQFSRAIADTRSELTSLLFEGTLSTSSFTQIARHIKILLLGGRDDFAATVVLQADNHLKDRLQQTRVNSKSVNKSSIAGVMMTDTELSMILNRVWLALAPFVGKSEINDATLEWGKKCLQLQLWHKSKTLNGGTALKKSNDDDDNDIDDYFNEFLVSTPTSLRVRLDDILGMFISEADLECYSTISSYLLAVRRGQIHLADLWRDGSIRRHFPAPAGPRQVNSKYGVERARKAREVVGERMDSLRQAWASCYNAMFVLVELGNFLADEIIPASWSAFETWASPYGTSSRPTTSTSDSTLASEGFGRLSTNSGEMLRSNGDTITIDTVQSGIQSDPEIVAIAHRQYLAGLVEALFLNEKSFTRILHALLKRIDQLVAFMHRLQSVQRQIDLENEGVELETGSNLFEDEQNLYSEIRSSSNLVTNDISRLIEQMRLLNDRPPKPRTGPDSRTGFEAWSGGNLMDRLLMRIDLSISTIDA